MSSSSLICASRKLNAPCTSASSLADRPIPRYELLKWEEMQQAKRGEALKRELEWATIAREIALMNRPYSR